MSASMNTAPDDSGDSGESGDSAPDTPATGPSTAGDRDAPRKGAKLSRAERLERKAAELRAAEQSAAVAGPGRTGRRDRPTGWWLVGAGVVIVGLVVALVLVEVQLHSKSADLRQAQRDAAAQTKLETLRSDALNTAEKYAVDFGSYDYSKLDQNFTLVSSHLTKSFAAKYQQISQQLKSVIVQYKGKSTATVEGAGISSFTAKRAVVVLFLDQTVTTTQSKQPRVDRNRLTMTLQRQPDGIWLISNLKLV